MEINFKENAPIYLQIVNQLKMDICSGKIAKGEKLPSVRELALTVKVNPNTIQRVYQELEREALILTRRGMGTYVTEDENLIEAARGEVSDQLVKDFVNNMERIGYKDQVIIEVVKGRLEGK